jgi:hypothetical protein
LKIVEKSEKWAYHSICWLDAHNMELKDTEIIPDNKQVCEEWNETFYMPITDDLDPR